MAVVKIKHTDKASALSKLGLTEEILVTAIKLGEVARDSCTKNDPPSAPGFDAWAKTVRGLRDILIPQKWMRCDDQNFSTVVSPNGKTAVAVATGNESTGLESGMPAMKYTKGAAAQSAVTLNQRYLFPEMEPSSDSVATRTTWLLLKRRSGDTVFAELSLPALMTKDGQVASWDTRIILSPILIDPVFEIEDDSTDDIDIPVIRRQSN